MRLYRVAVVIFLLAVTSLAQDPLKTLPKAYKLQFENDWVKVVRVHYEPREKLPAHEHTETASAYVYLNDSGPVVFKHLDSALRRRYKAAYENRDLPPLSRAP